MRTWTKRDPVKNYFPLPNEIYQLGLSHGAIAVYGYLLRIEDRKTYQCHPSYATIGKALANDGAIDQAIANAIKDVAGEYEGTMQDLKNLIAVSYTHLTLPTT